MSKTTTVRRRHHADGLLTIVVRDDTGHYRGRTEPPHCLDWPSCPTVAEAQWQVEERLRDAGHDCKALGCGDWFEPYVSS